MQLLLDNGWILLAGLRQTFQLAIATLACVTVVSILIGMLSVARYRWARIVAICYVEFFRDIPLLVTHLLEKFSRELRQADTGLYYDGSF